MRGKRSREANLWEVEERRRWEGHWHFCSSASQPSNWILVNISDINFMVKQALMCSTVLEITMQCAEEKSKIVFLFLVHLKKLAVSTICHHSAPHCKKFQFRNMLKLSHWREFTLKQSHINAYHFHLTSCCKSKKSGLRTRITCQLMLILLDFIFTLLGSTIWPFLCPQIWPFLHF